MSFLSKVRSEKSKMFDMLVCLVGLYFMAYFYYGARVIVLAIMAVLTSVITDVVCAILCHKKLDIKDTSTIVYALAFGAFMPASVPYGIFMLCCVIMIAVFKYAFGGLKNMIFSPIAAVYAFASLCWTNIFLTYPVPTSWGSLPLQSYLDVELTQSFTYIINHSKIPNISNFDLIISNYPGPLGTTHFILLCICALVLLARGSVSRVSFLASISVVSIFAFFSVPDVSGLLSVLYKLMSGSLIFGLIFLANDPYLTQKKRSERLAFGLMVGLFTVFFGFASDVENPVVFAVLLSNALIPLVSGPFARFIVVFRDFIKKSRLSFKKKAEVEGVEESAETNEIEENETLISEKILEVLEENEASNEEVLK